MSSSELNDSDLGDVLEMYVAVSYRLHQHFAPPGSPAVDAVQETGSLPVADVWASAHLFMLAAHEHLTLLAAGLRHPRVSSAIFTLGRAAQENAARALWVLDPADDVRGSVARHYALVLNDLAQLARVAQQQGAREHADAVRRLESMASRARRSGFSVGKLSLRPEVDAQRAPGSAELATVGLAHESAWAGAALFSLASSVAHGSVSGLMQTMQIENFEDLTLAPRLTPQDAGLSVAAPLLSHGLAYRELARQLGYPLDETWRLTRQQVMDAVTRRLDLTKGSAHTHVNDHHGTVRQTV